MKELRIFTKVFFLTISFLMVFPFVTAFASNKVYHVPIENEVEKGLESFLERAFEEAEENKAAAIILEIHTPGGFVDAAMDIAKIIEESPIKVIAFINTKAHSAGAYLALNADEIYMVPNATIGAAAIIDSEGNMAGEKANSAWISMMKAAAESSHRDPKYAMAMADINMDIPEFQAPKGTLLTLSAEEALQVNYSEGTVKNYQELLKTIGVEQSEVVELEPTIFEKIARFITNPVVVTLLLSIASLGLMIELFSPGFGIPGTMGLISLFLFFFGHTIAGFAGFETIILFIIGFVLILIEFLVPGGILGVIGGALMIISLLFAGESTVHMAYSILIAMFIAVLGMVVLVKFFGKHLHLFSKLILRDSLTTEEGYVSNINRIDLLGKVGKTIRPLRPSGTILVGKEKIDVVSEGNYIDENKFVKIIQVEGSRIVVREITNEEEDKK